MKRPVSRDARGAAAGIVELAVGTDSEAAENSGGEMLGGVSLGRRESPLFVGSADDAARLDSASREEAGEDVGPVVSIRCALSAGSILSTRRDRRNPWCPPQLPST